MTKEVYKLRSRQYLKLMLLAAVMGQPPPQPPRRLDTGRLFARIWKILTSTKLAIFHQNPPQTLTLTPQNPVRRLSRLWRLRCT